MIKCKNISKSFSKNEVISNLSVDFPVGSTLVSGANGSGKSTLLLLIAGIESLDSGAIIFSAQEKRNKIKSSISTDSIVPPDVFTLNELFKLQKAFNETNDELFESLVFETNLDRFLDCKIGTVSTGTKKKFSVVCALIKNSNLLMLDEPFNGVDNHSIEVLKEVILNDKRDKIIVEHQNVLPFNHLVSL